ncbi:hypothetical protein BLA24064_05188 [Burkholderia latens]|uniref:Uncharacterized protein n=1 Tax=Burkholderia latens TaxID=488446 RepID=A0A6P2PMH9_9BURK|nr:hypothetical protein BLA24064_05188 [Burkholderia latens]
MTHRVGGGRNRRERKTGDRFCFAAVPGVAAGPWSACGQRAASAFNASPVTRTMRHSGSTVAPIFS